VIRLLNRAVPIIAIQLSAFRIGDEVVLQFIPVLDVYESAELQDEQDSEPVDRAYWEKKSNRESLGVVDAVRALTPSTNGEPRTTYKLHDIPLSTSGYNFCWFNPRKTTPYCHLHIWVGAERRQDFMDRLESAGIEASNLRRSEIALSLRLKDIQEHRDLLAEIIRSAEELSHR
jgi:hypothetical protein